MIDVFSSLLYHIFMKKNLEIEYKTLLDEDQFEQLRSHMNAQEPTLQINTYYDTASLDLMQQHCMCRIRESKGSFLFTLKIPQEKGVMEYEQALVSPSLETAEIAAFLNTLGIDVKDLHVLTQSNTLRYEHKDPWGTWCLDETQFQNHKDYEVEYELHQDQSNAYDHYCKTLAALGISFKNHSQPKFLRALYSAKSIPL